MSYPKKPPEEKMLPIAGSVTSLVIEKVKLAAKERGISIAAMVGEIVTDWSKDKEGGRYIDPNQEELTLG